MSDETEITDQLDDVSAALLEPFLPNAIQTHPYKGWKYVAAPTVIRRLINATGNMFDWTIKNVEYKQYGKTELKEDGSGGHERTLIIVRGELTIYGLGTRSGVGVQVVTSETGGEDLWKGADADAFKNAAKNFGVALDLYGPDYEAGEIDVDQPRFAQQSQPRFVQDAQASDKQRDFIKSLQAALHMQNSEMLALTGGTKLDELNKHQASALIERLQGMKPATR